MVYYQWDDKTKGKVVLTMGTRDRKPTRAKKVAQLKEENSVLRRMLKVLTSDAEVSPGEFLHSADQERVLNGERQVFGEQNNRQVERELRKKSQEMEQFAYAASHDLRQPLNQLFAFCDFLERDLESGAEEKIQDDLAQLRSTATEMNKLITDLLKLSRAGSQELVREPVETSTVLREVCDLFKKKIRAKGAEIRKDDLPEVRCDRTLIKQVFQNLIGNALKYAGAEPVIKVGGKRSEEEVVFWVEDNGPGIPSAELEKVFLPMYRVADTGSESPGLGLATCKKIVERHGGRIRVLNRSEGGARFEFTLSGPSVSREELS